MFGMMSCGKTGNGSFLEQRPAWNNTDL